MNPSIHQVIDQSIHPSTKLTHQLKSSNNYSMLLPAVRPIGNLAYESVRPAHNESSAFIPFPRAVPKLMLIVKITMMKVSMMFVRMFDVD